MSKFLTYDQVEEESKKTIYNSSKLDVDKWKLQKEVYDLLLLKNRGKATELIVNAIKMERTFYTIRCDEKKEIWIYDNGIYIPQGESYIKEFTRQILGVAFTSHFVNDVTAKIMADTYIDQKTFFDSVDKENICLLNGILNLITRELKPFDSLKIFFNKIPITYDPVAVCPAVDAHFKAVLKKESDAPVIYELFGYLLWKEYFIEKAFMLSGSGRNGKGKTLGLMKRFIGSENCTNIPIQHLETDKFAVGELFNKMANLSGDIDKIALKHTGIFKNATGRDLLSASRKFMTNLCFVNYAKFIFCANELPKTYDMTPAFWNRWVLLEFPYTFVSQKEYDCLSDKTGYKVADPSIIEKLSTDSELSGLLNKALEGIDRLRTKGDFSYSKNTEELKNLWIKKSDSFSAFINDFCEEGDFEVEKGFFKKCYVDFCRMNRIKQLGTKDIANTMDDRGFWEVRDSSTRCWHGLRIKEVELIKRKDSLISEFVN